MKKDTSPSGISAVESHQNMMLNSQKAGSPKGASGTYSDAQNVQPGPTEATIARNQINSHGGPPMPPGSTADTGRKEP